MRPCQLCPCFSSSAGSSPHRLRELEGIIERGLVECLRLDPRLHSAYINVEMLAGLRYPDDAHQKVQLCARLVTEACKSGRFWVHPLQRPMHFFPKIRSQPWWDASEFSWAQKLIDNFDEIKREVRAVCSSNRSEFSLICFYIVPFIRSSVCERQRQLNERLSDGIK